MTKDMQLADYIIVKAHEQNYDLDNLKLQNTMFILDVVHRIRYATALFTADFVKGVYGANLTDVYHEYFMHGSDNLPEYENHLTGIDPDTQQLEWDVTDLNQIANADKTFIDQYVDRALQLDRMDLAKEVLSIPGVQSLKLNAHINVQNAVKYYKARFWAER